MLYQDSVGSPQGSLLSPLIFLIYIADVELWVDDVRVHGYADDTQSSYSSENEEDIVTRLEESAKKMLTYMASNSLSANPKKTEFMMIRKGRSVPKFVTIGNETIPEAPTHKILGLTINNSLSWDDQIYGTGGVLTSIRQRVGALKRLSYTIPQEYLPQIANAIVTSKLRYGLGIYGKARIDENEPKCKQMTDLQTALNKALRIVINVKKMDRISNKELYERTGTLSVNQMCGEDQLRLIWNSLSNQDSPLIQIFNSDCGPSTMLSRSKARGDLRTTSKTSTGQRNLPHSAITIWNKFANQIKTSDVKQVAKKSIRRCALALT